MDGRSSGLVPPVYRDDHGLNFKAHGLNRIVRSTKSGGRGLQGKEYFHFGPNGLVWPRGTITVLL